jgi:hypothetical protein
VELRCTDPSFCIVSNTAVTGVLVDDCGDCPAGVLRISPEIHK